MTQTERLKKYEKYIEDVRKKRILVPRTIEQLVARHLSDLKSSRKASFPYVFVPEIADKALMLASRFRVTQGQLGPDGKPVYLVIQDYQAFILAMIFGWRHKADKRVRKHREVFLFTARKTGKTVLAAIICIVDWLLSPEYGYQGLCAANSMEQAKIIYAAIGELLKTCPESYRKHLGITERSIKDTEITGGNSFIKRLASETSTADGYNACCVLLDEFAEAKNGKFLGTLRSGSGARLSPLFLITTTASYHMAGYPAYSKWETCLKVLAGKAKDDALLPIIYQQESTDEIHAGRKAKESAKHPWRKSNCNPATWNLQYLVGEYDSATAEGNLQYFSIKNMNVWTQDEQVAFLDRKAFSDCLEEGMEVPVGQTLVLGVDLSRVSDITSASVMWRDGGKLRLLNRSWIARVKAEKTSKVDWSFFLTDPDSRFTVSGEDALDIHDVLNFIEDLSRDNYVQMVYYDAHGAAFLKAQLKEAGIAHQAIQQSPVNLTPLLSLFEAHVLERNILIAPSKLLRWSVDNMAVKETPAGLRYPVKRSDAGDGKSSDNKIDPAVASLFCMQAIVDNKLY